MADPAITAEGPGRRFGDVTVLDGVDLELPAPLPFTVMPSAPDPPRPVRAPLRGAGWRPARRMQFRASFLEGVRWVLP